MTKTPLSTLTFICLDCESTGLDVTCDRVIEIAATRFTLNDGTVDTFSSLINPKRPIPPESTKIHKITDTMVEKSPSIDVFLPQLNAFIGSDPIVGHNISFDVDLLFSEATRHNLPCTFVHNTQIDTLRLARDYGQAPNNALDTLRKHFNIESEGAHRALADVRVNIAVFRKLVNPTSHLEDLLDLLSKPIDLKKMPLGKHKGRLFSDLPVAYLQWASHQDFDQDLLFSIRLELKRRKGRC